MRSVINLLRYVLIVVGYLFCLCICFLFNGGIHLLTKDQCPWGICRGCLRLFFLDELGLPRVNINNTSATVAFIFIFLLNFCTVISWNLGIVWPLGIVDCESCSTRPNSRKKIYAAAASLSKGLAGSTAKVVFDEPKSLSECVPKIPQIVDFSTSRKVSLRVVTRGDSVDFIEEICRHNVKVVEKFLANEEVKSLHCSLLATEFEWILEVVTEKPLGIAKTLGDCSLRVFEMVVPMTYETPMKTKAKARNLHYANQESVSVLMDDDFIVHLDEETIVTKSSLEGIAMFISRYPDCIGQGLTSFGRNYKEMNFLLTICDTGRVADDFLSFRVFHSLGSSLRGMKGSNYVIRVGIEKEVSFDVGPDCSLLEDTAFALYAGQKGVRFGHYTGVMHEQSPLTFKDYFRQRRRWIRGLMWVCSTSWVSLRYRWFLAISLFSWLTAPLSLLAFFVLIVFFKIPPTVFTVIVRTFICSAAIYGAMCGAVVNFSASKGLCRWFFSVLFAIVLIPVVSILEGLAVLYSMTTSTQSFDVVSKKTQSQTNRKTDERTSVATTAADKLKIACGANSPNNYTHAGLDDEDKLQSEATPLLPKID